MKCYSLTICGLLALVVSAPLNAADDELLLSDDFTSIKPGWGKFDGVQSVLGNKLYYHIGRNSTYTSLYRERLFGNVDLRVKIACNDGANNCSGGVVFWAADDKNYYFAQIYPDGTCGVSRKIEGKWIHPVEGRVVDAAKAGLGQGNDMRVVTSGDRATIYVNGEQFATLKGFPPSAKSRIGLRGESGAEPVWTVWTFAELSVRKGPAPTARPAATDESLLFADDFATLDPSWGIADDTLSGGDHKLILKSEPNLASTRLYRGMYFEDADIRVKVAQVNGEDTNPVGLVFWAKDYRNYRVVFVYPNGSARVAVRSDSAWGGNTTKTASEAVNVGPGAVNELRLVMRGNSAIAYVNDKELGTVGVKDPPGPVQVGLTMESGEEACTWEFSDFRCVRVSGSPP